MTSLHAQDAAKEFRHYRDSIQTLPAYDSATFFRLTNKLRLLARQMHSGPHEADVLHIIGTYYFFQKNISQTNRYFDSALHILQKTPDLKLQNQIAVKRSYIWIDRGDFEKAETFYNQQDPVYSAQKDTMALILLNMGRGQIYQAGMRNDESIRYMYRALNLAVASRNIYYEATCRNNLGGEYTILGKHEQAKAEYLRALELTEKSHNRKLSASVSGNLASLYIQENKFSQALGIYNNIITLYETSGFYYEMAYVYLNMAYCYSQMNNTAMMKYYGEKSIHTLIEHHLPVDAVNVYVQVAGFYAAHNQFDDVLRITTEASQFATASHIPIADPTFYDVLSKTYEHRGDYAGALRMHKRFAALEDSIGQINNTKQMNELISKYELNEKEQKIKLKDNENALLRKENELASLNRIYIIVVSAMILVLIAFVAFGLTQRKLKKQKDDYAAQLINDIDRERERIAMDLHDDIGLQITMVRHKLAGPGPLDAQSRQDMENTLQKLLEQTRKLSRDLYPAPLKHLSFQEFTSELLNTIESKTGIICSQEIDPKIDTYNLDIKMHILRMLQECLHNSLKYSKASAIRIEIKPAHKKLLIIYQDNGIGIPDNLRSHGLGLQNMHQRARQIQADVQVARQDNNSGVKIIITRHE
ncbi:MAG: tetratricopeptide repeat protein [Bacteroidetes bacterium]|nr:tetratricopeptide repeat protein [Bacteroidota bacterium]